MICTVCCATKRLVEIACPSDCVYLSSSRAHPPAVVQRRQERDVAFVMPLMAELTEVQTRLLIVFQSVAVRYAQTASPPLLDVDVAEAAAAAAATIETARKGIIYQHQAVSVPAQRFSAELSRTIGEIVGENSAQQARIERDSAIALRKLEQGARTAEKQLAGDEPPVYLALLARLLQNRDSGPDGAAETPAAPQPTGLILPP